MVQTSTVIGFSAASAATALLAYAVYFDYKRRHDIEFRKTLRKQRKKAAKEDKKIAENEKSQTGKGIEEALAHSKSLGPLPTQPQEKHQFFVVEVQNGEDTAAKGPMQFALAAAHFYRALQVYPDQIELAMVFQRSLPSPIFELIMGMLEADALQRKTSQEKDLDIDGDEEERIKEVKESSSSSATGEDSTSSAPPSTVPASTEPAWSSSQDVPNSNKENVKSAPVSSAPSSDAGSAGDFSIINKDEEQKP